MDSVVLMVSVHRGQEKFLTGAINLRGPVPSKVYCSKLQRKGNFTFTKSKMSSCPLLSFLSVPVSTWISGAGHLFLYFWAGSNHSESNTENK